MPADHEVQAHPSRYFDALRADVRAGLTATPKTLPPKWFYDDRGSILFDQITRLPEYYPTRTETAILVELGSGTSTKPRLLLDALHGIDTLTRFVPFDCSEATLLDAGRTIADA